MKFSLTGGARIGMMNASWPLAKLAATPQQLTLKVQLLGNYSFLPSQVRDLIPYKVLPILGEGIQIIHNNPSYKKRIIFWTLGMSPQGAIEKIKQAGFQPGGEDGPMTEAERVAWQAQQGFPFQIKALLVIGLVWAALMFLGVSRTPIGEIPNGPAVLGAFGFLMLVSLSTFLIPAVRRLILKPGHNLQDAWLALLLFGGIMPLIFLLSFWMM